MTTALVPFVHVASVERSIEFYAKLGFAVANAFTPEGDSSPAWAWLESGNARLMLATADPAIDASVQGVLFYLYCSDVPAAHAALRNAGIDVGDIHTRFYAPHGEFRITDPDGYVLMMTHE